MFKHWDHLFFIVSKTNTAMQRTACQHWMSLSCLTAAMEMLLIGSIKWSLLSIWLRLVFETTSSWITLRLFYMNSMKTSNSWALAHCVPFFCIKNKLSYSCDWRFRWPYSLSKTETIRFCFVRNNLNAISMDTIDLLISITNFTNAFIS